MVIEMNLRRRIKQINQPLFKIIRELYYLSNRFRIPVPKSICYPIWQVTNFIRNIYYWIIRVFWATAANKGWQKWVDRMLKGGLKVGIKLNSSY